MSESNNDTDTDVLPPSHSCSDVHTGSFKVDSETVLFDVDETSQWIRSSRSITPAVSQQVRPRTRNLTTTHTTSDSLIPSPDVGGPARRHRGNYPTRYRDELERVNELNAVIRGVNTALISATTRENLATAVCERMANLGRYRAVCMADLPTWFGIADRWTVAGAPPDENPTLPTLDDSTEDREVKAVTESPTTPVSVGDWTVVPISYNRTVYGAFGVLSAHMVESNREREVLTELGRVIGHAINAIETRRLIADEASIELELKHPDDSDALVAVAAQTDCRFSLEGIVPVTDKTSVAYLHVKNAAVETVAEALADASGSDARTIRAGKSDGGGVIEWTVTGDSLLAWLGNHGATITEVTADSTVASYTVEMASDIGIRTLLDRVRYVFPETCLTAKRELGRPIDSADEITAGDLEKLTDRQREAMEVAFRAGYYQWPRESTAEEVAETMGITASTLHAHLRKAEKKLLGELFDVESRPSRDRSG